MYSITYSLAISDSISMPKEKKIKNKKIKNMFLFFPK